jgi:hypothetical protein
MVLIEFLFAGKNSEDQEYHSSERYRDHTSFITIVVFILGGTSMREFAQY